MSDTPSALAQIEQAISTKIISFISVWGGMFGGSVATFLAKVGDADIVAGVGVVVAVLGLILKAWHNRCVRRQTERLEYAKMTAEQRAVYDEN